MRAFFSIVVALFVLTGFAQKQRIDYEKVNKKVKATYYYQDSKDLLSAEKYIKNALKVEENNSDFEYLLALIYQAQGKINQANTIMQRLKSNQ